MIEERNAEIKGARLPKREKEGANWHETTLIKRIAENEDRDAFKILYLMYCPRLVQFLRKLSRNVPLIEDVANETMLIVWQKAGSFNHTSKVSTWIFSIAYRQCLEAIRKAEEPVEMNLEDSLAPPEWEPEFGANCSQLKKQIENALYTLSVEQRSVIALTYYHGMSYEEIALTMNCPANTVKTRMFHARKKLKVLLSAYQKGES